MRVLCARLGMGGLTHVRVEKMRNVRVGEMGDRGGKAGEKMRSEIWQVWGASMASMGCKYGVGRDGSTAAVGEMAESPSESS